MIRKRVIVSGTVQGVGFRWYAREKANDLGLTGFARNRDDGTVEAEIEGSPAAIDRMLAWFEHGPAGAHVTGLDTRDIDPEGDIDFRIHTRQ